LYSEKKLHILFLSSWYPSRVFETHGNFVQKHAQAVALRHKVTVVYPVGDASKKTTDFEVVEDLKNGVHEIVIYFKKHSVVLINAKRKYKALLRGLENVEHFDIIHGNILYPIGVLALLVKKKYKVPLIFTEHWTGYLEETNYRFSKVQKLFIKKTIKKSTFVVPVSRFLKQSMLKSGFKGNYVVVGNAIDTNIFKPKKSEHQFNILHVSYLNNKQKNVKGILEVIKILSQKKLNFTLNIIGDGDHNEVLKYIDKLELPTGMVKLHTTKTPNQVALLMQQANIYVSFSNYETFGVVMIEALACGVPVISTNTGVLLELKHQDYFRIIKKNDKNSLQQYLEYSIKKNPVFNSDKMHAFVVSKYSFTTISKKYSKLYYKALENA